MSLLIREEPSVRGRRTAFTWGINNETGMDGWIPDAQPEFDPSNGLGVAHDSLEHLKLHEGTIEQECHAFGVMLYGRGLGGYFYQLRSLNPDPVWHMGASLGGAFRDVFEAGREGPLKKPTGRIYPVEDGEDLIGEIVRQTVKSFDLEADAYPGQEEWFNAHRLAIKQNLALWLRKGARDAERYYRAPSWALSDLFRRVAEKVDEFTHIAEEGDRLVVTVQRETLNWSVKARPASSYAYGY